MKTERNILLAVSVAIILLLIVVFIETGMARGGWLSSVLVLLGLVCLVIAWVQYFKKEKKRKESK